MESVSQEDFVTLMPLFTNLQTIKLQRLDFIGKNTLSVIPNGLTSLSLTSDLFNKDNKELFHRLNSTITELSLTWYNWDTAAQPKGLSQLQNIQELTCIRLVGKKCINQLLKVNLTHLRDLSLVFYTSSKFDGELWQLIGRMSSLRKLYVNLCDTDICIPSIRQGSLPMLQKLFINSDREEGVGAKAFLNSIDVAKLEYLRYDGCPFDIDRELMAKIKRIPQLYLRDRKGKSFNTSLDGDNVE